MDGVRRSVGDWGRVLASGDAVILYDTVVLEVCHAMPPVFLLSAIWTRHPICKALVWPGSGLACLELVEVLPKDMLASSNLREFVMQDIIHSPIRRSTYYRRSRPCIG